MNSRQFHFQSFLLYLLPVDNGKMKQLNPPISVVLRKVREQCVANDMCFSGECDAQTMTCVPSSAMLWWWWIVIGMMTFLFIFGLVAIFVFRPRTTSSTF